MASRKRRSRRHQLSWTAQRRCDAVRRSGLAERKRKARGAAKDQGSPGIVVRKIPKLRGVGVFCTRSFAAGSAILRYDGETLSLAEGHRRDDLRTKNPAAHPRGVIFFARKFAVDPGDGHHISYKINHSARQANLHVVAERAQDSGDDIVVFHAARDIAAGEQLLYDYGDRRRETVVAFPWLMT